MSPPWLTYSWIGLTALTPLSALLITWTLVSIHKKRLKSILLLAIVYSQLIFQTLNFTYSTLTLLKLDRAYVVYISYAFNVLLFFKSASVLSLHLEEFYKLKSPSNYILNVNSSLLKYHLMVIFVLSLMGTYFFRHVTFVPGLGLGTNSGSDLLMSTIYLSFQSLVILLSLFFLALKALLRKRSLEVNIIIGGTNSTSSSANLFGMRDGHGGRLGRAATAVAGVNLIINISLIACTLSPYWLPFSWPLPNVITWSQVLESILTTVVYWLAHGRRTSKSNASSARYQKQARAQHAHSRFPITNGSLCFNNGEFTYFAGGKNSSSDEAVLNNAMSSAYNTFDSFHQTRSYQDSLRCASVTTIANDDFEFHSRGYGPLQIPVPAQPPVPLTQETPEAQVQVQGFENSPCNSETMIIRRSPRKSRRNQLQPALVTASLSMNDLDLIGCRREGNSSSSASTASEQEGNGSSGKCKYKKKSNGIKRRFTQSRMLTRRVLSLESLHNHVNESHLAYLDTGERVIVFTTDFL